MSAPQPNTVEYWAATTPGAIAFIEGGRRLICAEHIVAKATTIRGGIRELRSIDRRASGR